MSLLLSLNGVPQIAGAHPAQLPIYLQVTIGVGLAAKGPQTDCFVGCAPRIGPAWRKGKMPPEL